MQFYFTFTILRCNKQITPRWINKWKANINELVALLTDSPFYTDSLESCSWP